MPRPNSQLPKLCCHRASKRGVVRLSGHDHYVGPWPSPHTPPPPDTQAEYDRLIAMWLANGRRPLNQPDATPAGTAPTGPTLNELILLAWKFAEQHYRRPDGTPTNEQTEIRQSLRPLRAMFGPTPAAEFGPKKLAAVRERMVESGLCRTLVNCRVNRIKRCFRWAAAEELIPATVYEALRTLPGLRAGRTRAPEPKPVGPVAPATVDATLPHLNRHARGLVEFQRLTGCRPGEACLVRRTDIDATGAVWLFSPPQHKTAHRGKSRVVAIGPRAQDLLRQFFTTDPGDYLFSPRRAVEEFHAERTAGRMTPRYASHMRRNAGKRVRKPKRPPAERYTTASYGHAVGRACDRAFPPPAPLAQRDGETRAEWWGRLTVEQRVEVKAWRKAHRWHPNQLRHAFAIRVRGRWGLEAAGASLGHTKMSATEIYAERDIGLAVKVAFEAG